MHTKENWLFFSASRCTGVVGADLVVRFSGYGRVSWTENRTTYIKGSAPSVSCKNTETYLDHSLSLLSKGTQLRRCVCVSASCDAIE